MRTVCESCSREIMRGLKTKDGCIWCDIKYWQEKHKQEIKTQTADCFKCKYWDYVRYSGFAYCNFFCSEIIPWAWDICKGKYFKKRK